jgi:hypothetical protein
MRGGFLDNLSNTLSGWGSSLSQGATSMWEKTKNTTSSLTGSTPSSASSVNTSSSYQSPMTTSTYGGKRHRRSRRMRGGFKDNTPTSGIASTAAPISDVKTAQPQTIVGGRTRRRRGRKGRKTRRH